MEQSTLGFSKDLPPGRMKEFAVNGKELLVVNLANQFYCLDGRCTHARGHLAQGTLSGDVVTCPRHGSRFKVTDGSVVGGPASKSLATYKIVAKDGQLLVEV